MTVDVVLFPMPAEEDVAGCLNQVLTRDHALPLVRELAGANEAAQD